MSYALPASSIQITQEMIDVYAEISGDFNPLHVDPEAAARTPFGGTIAHGCIPMEPIFKAVQQRLGLPALPPSTRMSLRYLRPSRPGDTIHIESRATDEDVIGFACLNQNGEKVLEGTCRLPRGDAE